jgi:hypothetical protein
MVTQVNACMEVAGCPTICQHCWAQGVPYPAMPVPDIAYVLEQASAACAAGGLSFAAYPMHEVAAHPEASAVLRLFARYPGDRSVDAGRPMYEPFSTTGVPLTLRPDWEEVLATCRELGTTVVWPAVHGRAETHDRMVHRAGAYQETLLGIDRMRAAGMEVSCNVFLTRENLGQFDALVADLLAHGVTQFSVEPASFLPTARSRRYEVLRPTLADLAPLVERVRALPGPFFGCEIWSDLAAYTEAAYVRRALEGTWPPPLRPVVEEVTLVCRPNLDLYWGLAGRYRRRYGNLRHEDAREVFGAALPGMTKRATQAAPVDERIEQTEHTRCEGEPDDAIWFTLDPLPSMRELAERFGDPAGDRVHFWPRSLRYRWLDLAERVTTTAV